MLPSVRLFIAGDFASFTRPEAKVERNSYPLPTPSAARNILDSILWKPEFRWIVTRILLVKHPRATAATPPSLPSTIALKRNELQSTLAPRTINGWMQDPSSYKPQAAGAGQGTDGTPRMTTALKNVAYVIEAYRTSSTPAATIRPRNTLPCSCDGLKRASAVHSLTSAVASSLQNSAPPLKPTCLST